LLIIPPLKTLDNLTNLAAVEASQGVRLDGGDIIALYDARAELGWTP
jgi:hypothetical protein